jgi:hypothetical protein
VGEEVLVAILTIFLGALGTAGGLQELVVQGIGNNEKIPLAGGTLGVVSGALTVAAGIALLCQSRRAVELTRAAAVAGAIVAVLVGKLVWGLAGWPMTLAGLAWPAFLLFHVRDRGGRGQS